MGPSSLGSFDMETLHHCFYSKRSNGPLQATRCPITAAVLLALLLIFTSRFLVCLFALFVRVGGLLVRLLGVFDGFIVAALLV
jgi:hypothetical protein